MKADSESQLLQAAMAIAVDAEVDASGLACPMPLLKAKQGLNKLQAGQTLRLRATDAGSLRDVKSFAELSGNALLAQVDSGDHYIFVLQKA